VWRLSIHLVVRINPLLLLDISLDSLGHEMVLSNSSLSFFEGSVSQDLLSPDDLELHGIHLVLIGFLVLHQLRLSHLLLPFEVDLVDLPLVEPFEMVWFHAMGSQHTHLCLGVLGHEIGVICLVDLNSLLIVPILMLEDFSVLLLLSQDSVDAICLLLILSPLTVVLTLCVRKVLME
jgi:hypothetical protein